MAGGPLSGTTIRCVLILSLDAELLPRLVSHISQTTQLHPIVLSPDTNDHNENESSPLRANSLPRTSSMLKVASASLTDPEYMRRLIHGAKVSSILLDLRGHRNELGLTCAFLRTLRLVRFIGHVVYLSVAGDLLSPGEQSRKLRESHPIHAAVEMQLRSPPGAQTRVPSFTWTILGLGRSHNRSTSSSPASQQSPESTTSAQTSANSPDSTRGIPSIHVTPPEEHSQRQTAFATTLSSIVRLLSSQVRLSASRKIMLETSGERRSSFMHQTDWGEDEAG